MLKTLEKILFCLVACFFAGLIVAQPAVADAEVDKQIPLNQYGIRSSNPYVVNRFVQDGRTIDEVIVPSRPNPPKGFTPKVVMVPKPDDQAGTNTISNVPAMTWCFGCSATSAAMMFGHYDNVGYTNMYAGPTNGGVFPMTNASWGTTVINGETRALCPLSATMNGLDGRTTRGHVDDYWIKYGSTSPDPFITNGWTEHTHGDCTGDYMGTNQSEVSNVDGSTTFYYSTDGSALYDYTGAEPDRRDGCHGMRLFAESRGYTVVTNFSQYIYGYEGNTKGFTFENFKAEIDAGRPVLIQVEGHTMLGYGYDDSGSTIYIHDTWDYNDHSMTWGGIMQTCLITV
ncbi:MAG: C39 family peptidase [Thermodesulfobacteriota bacterium]